MLKGECKMRYIYRDVEFKAFYCNEVTSDVDVCLTVAEVPDSGDIVELKKVECTDLCPLGKNKKCKAFDKISEK